MVQTADRRNPDAVARARRFHDRLKEVRWGFNSLWYDKVGSRLSSRGEEGEGVGRQRAGREVGLINVLRRPGTR
jgi:hypothetical protein